MRLSEDTAEILKSSGHCKQLCDQEEEIAEESQKSRKIQVGFRSERVQGQDNMEEFFKTREELSVVLYRKDA